MPMGKGYIFHVTMVPCDGTIVTRKISLGPNETRLLFGLEKEGKTVFSFNDATRILSLPSTASKKVIYRLRRKGRIIAAQKGRYILAPARAGIEGDWSESPLLIIPHLIDEYYVGFWTAMNYWGMSKQVPNTLFIATTKRKRRIEYSGQTLRFITVSTRKFFGFTQERIDSNEFNISTREKTVADALVFPQYCGGLSEVTKAVWTSRKELDWKKVVACIRKMAVDVALRRLGYILSILRIEPDIVRSFTRRRWRGFRYLDPTASKRALAYSKELGLIINIPDRKLTGWRGR